MEIWGVKRSGLGLNCWLPSPSTLLGIYLFSGVNSAWYSLTRNAHLRTYSRGGEGLLLFHLIPSFVCVLHWWMSASDSPRQTSPGLKTVRHFPSQSSCSQLYQLSSSLPRILSVFLALGGGAGGWDDLGNLFCSFEVGQPPETSFSMTVLLPVPPYSLEVPLPFLYTHLVASGKKIASF